MIHFILCYRTHVDGINFVLKKKLHISSCYPAAEVLLITTPPTPRHLSVHDVTGNPAAG